MDVAKILILLIMLQWADIATTAYALESDPGTVEGNPLAVNVIQNFGLQGLISFKVAGVCAAVALFIWSFQATPRFAVASLFVALLGYFVIVTNNLAAITLESNPPLQAVFEVVTAG